MANPFEVVPELKIAQVVEVAGTTIRAELSVDVTELTRSHGGRVYSIGQFGNIVKIHIGRRLVFGFVTLLRMRSDELVDSDVRIPPDADQRVLEIELFAEGDWSTEEKDLAFSRGVTIYPLPRQAVYLLTKKEAGLLYTAAEGSAATKANSLIPFGSYVGVDSAVCHANIDKMFSMHCVVLGSTGSGKSGAVASIVHSILEHKPTSGGKCSPRIVILDPHGEYGSAFGERAIVFRAYDPIGKDAHDGESIKLPYWLMSAEEIRSLVIGKTEHEATSQHNIVYKALAHARMVTVGLVEPAPTSHGTSIPDNVQHDEPRPRAGVKPEALAEFDRDKSIPFSWDEFSNHIEFIQGARVGKATKKLEPIPPSEEPAKKTKHVLDKLAVLRRDSRAQFLMKEWVYGKSPQLSEVLQQLVGVLSSKEERDIRVVDISGLPNEIAGPLTALIARLLFQYKLYQTHEEKHRDPILLICEEAHRYVPDKGEAEYSAAQMAVRRIAKEGRKYGLGLMLVSQRPADIDGTVISQCGTWLVLRLSNAADQQHVARFLPDGLSGMTRSLPSLSRQEAIFVGEGAALPARIRIRDLPESKLPKSASIPFALGWMGPRNSIEELKVISTRMDGTDNRPIRDTSNDGF